MSSVLPAQPSLEQLKKQAKDLMSAHSSHSPECLPVLRHLTRFKNSTDKDILGAKVQLADVQFALAIEYGFTTWEDLVRHVENRKSGLGERATLALARLRKNGTLAGIIGGEIKAVADGSWGDFTIIHLEGPQGWFVVEETAPEGPSRRLINQQRLGEFLNASGVQAPRITFLEAEGRTFGVSQKIEGIPCGSVPLSESDQDAIVKQLVGLLNRMHAVPLPEACRILDLPPMSPEEATQKYRFGFDWLEVNAFENALKEELQADAELNALWRETREWATTYFSKPADLVFGHGDLWIDSALLAKTPDGYRLSGLTGLHNAGLVNLYDEFLRVGSLGLFDVGYDEKLGRALVEAYNRLPGQTRRVEEVPLRHAIRAFWFYLAHEQSGDDRKQRLASAKRSTRKW